MSEYRLRRTEQKDKQLLYQWASDKTVRENSFHTGEISISEHDKWFEEHINAERCDMFILEYDGKPVGQIRIDWDDDCGEISYSIADGCRGQGHGTRLLHMIRDELKGRDKRLVAKVKRENVASECIFEHAGYNKTINNDYILYTINL